MRLPRSSNDRLELLGTADDRESFPLPIPCCLGLALLSRCFPPCCLGFCGLTFRFPFSSCLRLPRSARRFFSGSPFAFLSLELLLNLWKQLLTNCLRGVDLCHQD